MPEYTYTGLSNLTDTQSSSLGNYLTTLSPKQQEEWSLGLNTPNNSTETGWGMDGYGGLALGVGQFGLGLAGFLDGKKTAGLQRDLMKQQLASNKAQWNAQATKMNDLRAWNGQSKVATTI